MSAEPVESSQWLAEATGGGAAPAVDARAFLQERIAALFRLMFWSLAALVGFLSGLYAAYEDAAPERRLAVYAIGIGGLAVMAFIWRVLLVRRPLSIAALYRLDLVYSFGIGTAFGVAAYLQYDLRASGYLALVYSTFAVFARALIVPSSGARTALASALTMLPMTLSALALALRFEQDVPAPAYFIGYQLFGGVLIVLSASGSRIIYGLRRQVSATQQLGQYAIDRKIGEGGMGAVYLAHHTLLRRPTAVKLVLPERVGVDNLARFEREVQHMSRLTHPNTVAVYDYGRSLDGVFYYAMEYLGGGIDLSNLVRRFGAQPGGRVAAILAQVCGALNEAHANGIIHRDIKPANIILCERGGLLDVAKVVDYGLVKELTVDTDASAQVILGTPSYLAPEAMLDPRSVGPAVDLYAVGAVGYYLLTGKPVFTGATAVAVMVQHATATPRPLSEVAAVAVAPELEAIVMRCLAKRAEDRYASAAELRDQLLALPRSADWDDREARLWWDHFRALEQAAEAASSMPTMTIRVDVSERAAARRPARAPRQRRASVARSEITVDPRQRR